MHFAVALAVLAFFLQAPQADKAALTQNAIQALQIGDDRRAEDMFRQLLSIDPLSAVAYCNLGVIYMHRNELPAAIGELTTAHKLTPDSSGVAMDLALAYYRSERFTDALPLFEQAHRGSPSQRDVDYLLGLTYFRLNKYQQTIETLRPIYSEKEHNLFYLYAMTISYGHLKMDDEAKKAFYAFQAAGSDTVEFHELMGRIYLDLFDNGNAINEFQRAIATSSAYPYAHLLLGAAYQQSGMTEAAEKQYKVEIQNTPGDSLSYRNLATIYLHQGKTEAAIEMFSASIARDPSVDGGLTGIGEAYLDDHDYTHAELYLQRAIGQAPDDAEAHYLMSRTLQAEGRASESKREMATVQQLIEAGHQLSKSKSAVPLAARVLPALPASSGGASGPQQEMRP